ncbi:carbamate kinase [Hyperthermus butylicus]|uniref:Carbamate kinase n=1 Tax=Hyperthermus butylicus (strain DSM 5456 / JCM 9403 / PLM1-5) TaxID=415426 RepID=A2BJI0_HYPBU|nr:carbamate kinase [Hyperthermus butylicus]ABM80141.1 Carbamate kinase [Hyperthermus butylicus DSM 5456]
MASATPTPNDLYVIALGGNAFMKKGEGVEAQWHNVEKAARQLVDLIEQGYRIVVTHGNGPQVGLIVNWVHHYYGRPVERLTLDIAGAMTQGWLGYMLQQAIGNELERRGMPRRVVTLVSQVLVDRNDPAFQNPTKYVGPYYSREEAERIAKETGWVFKPDPRGGYRRVVPSPKPLRVVEIEAVKRLIEQGFIVITVGGGGIPVVSSDGRLRGVEAVIDKDLASSLLAQSLRARALIILTDVDYVYLNYGKPNQQPLKLLKASEARRLLEEGHFPPGSMGPKVQAAIEFVEAMGEGYFAAIGSLDNALAVARGEKGTRIVPG